VEWNGGSDFSARAAAAGGDRDRMTAGGWEEHRPRLDGHVYHTGKIKTRNTQRHKGPVGIKQIMTGDSDLKYTVSWCLCGCNTIYIWIW
jgi:hypothetical protein